MKNPLKYMIHLHKARTVMTAGVALALAGTFMVAPSCGKSSNKSNNEPIVDFMGFGRATEANKKANTPIDYAQEYYIGRMTAANLIDEYGVYNDRKAVEYVNKVGSVFVYGVNDTPATYNGYHFIILNTKKPMAFAAPGAYIMISKGLITACKSEEELACVLAHEVAHIRQRHAVEAIEKIRKNQADMANLNVLANLTAAGLGAGGEGQAAAALKLAQAFGDLVDDGVVKFLKNGYSIEQEIEADADAIKMLKRVGYDASQLKQS